MRRVLAAAFLLAAAPALALDGYVVKVDSDSVYLDLGLSSGVAAGQPFTVFSEGEELIHPVSHQSLGRVEKRVASGEIREVAAAYSVGKLLQTQAPAVPGQRVRLQAPAVPSFAAEPSAETGGRRPVWRSPVLEMQAADLDVADVDGDGRPDLVLADATRVQALPADATAESWKPLCAYEDKDTGVRFLSVDAADLNGDGRAEVFASYHNEFFGRLETAVLECRDGKLVRAATLPYLVRSYADVSGARSLAAQSVLPDASFPLGAIYPLRFAEGKYQLGAESIRLPRLTWIYSFARTDSAPGAPVAVFYDEAGRLRAQMKKGAWTAPDSMGQTANRVRWHDHLLKFPARLPTIPGDKGFSGVYAVRNHPRLGTLADAFGLYGRGEVQRLRWNGLALETEWTAPADGYVAGIASAPNGGAVYAAIVGHGSTSVWKF